MGARKPVRWTWAKMVEVLVARGYACGVRTMHGRKVYEVIHPGGFKARFDTVEEIRDSFGFHADEGGGVE